MDGRFLNVGPGIVPYSSLYKKPTTAFLIFWISAAGRSSKNSAGSPVTFVATIFAYVVVLSGTKLDTPVLLKAFSMAVNVRPVRSSSP